MPLTIGTIEYEVNEETFTVENITIISRKLYNEEGGYKEPEDTVEVVEFEAYTDHGMITGNASARRSGYENDFEYEDNIELEIDNDEYDIELACSGCIVEEDNDDF